MLVKLDGGAVINYSLRMLRDDNPRVSFPEKPTDETLAEYGVYQVEINAPKGKHWSGVINHVAGQFVPVYEDDPYYDPKGSIWNDIKAIRDHKSTSGGYRASGKWFHSDLMSRTQQIGLVMMGAGIPEGIMWKTMDGSFVQMTQALAAEIFAAAAAQDSALFGFAEALNAQVQASADPTSIDIKTGWPAVYGDAQ
jgi:hypothetical protein